MISGCFSACAAMGVLTQPSGGTQGRAVLHELADAPGAMQLTRPRGAILTISFFNVIVNPYIMATKITSEQTFHH